MGRGDWIAQLLMVMFLKPPLDSVPILNALQWLLRMQLVMITFSHGRSSVLFRHRASSSRVDAAVGDRHVAAAVDVHRRRCCSPRG